jgi:hypothetical protein
MSFVMPEMVVPKLIWNRKMAVFVTTEMIIWGLTCFWDEHLGLAFIPHMPNVTNIGVYE